VSIVYPQYENVDLSNVFASSSSSSSSSSNSSNFVTEGNSTFSNSTPGVDQVVSKVIVIPNPNPVPSTTSNNSSDINNAKSDVLVSNETNYNLQGNESGLVSQDTINSQQSNNSSNNNINSSSQNDMQRGEYKVDNNGFHYYNINNCSLVKGSSGIGDLSECEDAEREIQEELTG